MLSQTSGLKGLNIVLQECADTPELLVSYDHLISTELTVFLSHSSDMTELVQTQVLVLCAVLSYSPPIQAKMVECLFQHQREFLASSCSAIPASAGSGLRIAEEIQRIQSFAGEHVSSSSYPLLCCIGLTVPALGWVVLRHSSAQVLCTEYRVHSTACLSMSGASTVLGTAVWGGL